MASNDKPFDFNDLFVLDLANNHQGDIEHGKNIINSLAAISKELGIKTGIKFQFRQLDSYIHPDHQENSDNKHITRFISTKLSIDAYKSLFKEIEENKLIKLCTAFDEASVDVIQEMGFDVVKVASCSAQDWPLLERVAESGLSVICSTGGLTLAEIDGLVSFFEHRGVNFALMYCVSIYPIPDDEFNLNMIDSMRDRYKYITIGWSTHENPDDLVPVQIAVAKGARMFERHVGIESEKHKLNAYSSTPEQIRKWMLAYQHARKLCGNQDQRLISKIEKESINSLMRTVYAKNNLKKGSALTMNDIYFAMPYVDDSLASGDWNNKIIVESNFDRDMPLMKSDLIIPEVPNYMILKSAIHKIKVLLNQARIVLNSDFKVEYSHHYGIKNFNETGAVIINCINREYCKKIIAQLPGQKHPSHFHKRKEETFQVLYGTLEVSIDSHRRKLEAGETCLVQPGVWHRFWTDTGCVFEEISTTHFNNDSYYADKKINEMKREDRKTIVDHWGRFEMVDYLS